MRRVFCRHRATTLLIEVAFGTGGYIVWTAWNRCLRCDQLLPCEHMAAGVINEIAHTIRASVIGREVS